MRAEKILRRDALEALQLLPHLGLAVDSALLLHIGQVATQHGLQRMQVRDVELTARLVEARTGCTDHSPRSSVGDPLAFLALAAGLRRHHVAIDDRVARSNVLGVAEERREMLRAAVRLLRRRIEALAALQI